MENTTKTAPAVKPQKVVLLVVKKDQKLRGARMAWYLELCKHDGKPATAYLEACTAKPPSLPKKGVAEKPSGWLRYFLRTGLVALK